MSYNYDRRTAAETSPVQKETLQCIASHMKEHEEDVFNTQTPGMPAKYQTSVRNLVKIGLLESVGYGHRVKLTPEGKAALRG